MGSIFCYRHLSIVEATSTVTSQHSELFCLLWSMRITISYSWFRLPRKNFRRRLSQQLWTESENGERFFRLSAASTFERKKEASSLFICCWWSIPLTRSYNENLLRRVSEGINWKTLNYHLCRTRRVVENAFGITSSVFRVLRKPILLQPQKLNLSYCTGHNTPPQLPETKHSFCWRL